MTDVHTPTNRVIPTNIGTAPALAPEWRITNRIATAVLFTAGAGAVLHLILGLTLPLWLQITIDLQQITDSLQRLH